MSRGLLRNLNVATSDLDRIAREKHGVGWESLKPTLAGDVPHPKRNAAGDEIDSHDSSASESSAPPIIDPPIDDEIIYDVDNYTFPVSNFPRGRVSMGYLIVAPH
jgi:hypothetical protein